MRSSIHFMRRDSNCFVCAKSNKFFALKHHSLGDNRLTTMHSFGAPLATREKTAHLKALRLAKEAQAQSEEPPPKTNVRPLKNRGKG